MPRMEQANYPTNLSDGQWRIGLLPKIWSSCYESPRSMDPDEDTS
jgi:hypothetical protein